MIVELEKNMMTGMLTVLGKLVNRNAADKSYLALRLEAKDGVLKFSTHSATEQLTYQMTVQCAESFTGYAEFDAFRDAVRSCRAKNVQLSCDENVLTVSAQAWKTAIGLQEVDGLAPSLPIFWKLPNAISTAISLLMKSAPCWILLPDQTPCPVICVWLSPTQAATVSG